MIGQVILCLAAIGQSGGKAAEWKPFTSPKGKYTISLPTKPTEKRRVLAASGKTIELVTSTARQGLATFAAASADLAGANPEAAMKAAQADLVAQSRGELKEEKEVALGNVTGRELSIEIPKKVVSGGAVQTARMYVAGGRLFEVVATVPVSKIEAMTEEVGEFFDSFRPAGVDLDATVTAEAAPKSKAAAATKGAAGKASAPKAGKEKASPKAGAMLGGLAGLNPFGTKADAPPADAVPPAASAPGGALNGLGPEWKLFSPPAGGYTIAMPGDPVEVKQTIQTPAGPIGVVMYMVEGPEAAHMVASNDVPAGVDVPGNAQNVLEGTKQGMLGKAPGSKVLEETKIEHQGFPGRDLTLEVPAGPTIPVALTMRVRVVLAKGRLYQVQAARKGIGGVLPDAAPYFASFKIGGEAAPAGATAMAAPGPKPGVPREFTPADGAFTVTTPAPFLETKIPRKLGGPPIDGSVYIATHEGRSYRVLATEIPPSEAQGLTTDKVFARLRETLIHGGDGKILREERVEWDGLPAMEFDVASDKILPPSGGVSSGRMILDLPRKRLYSVSVIVPKGTAAAEATKAFLDSFHVKIKGPGGR